MTKNAHLLGTLRRCLKLMYLRIKPVFVFDGQTPVLKLKTLKQRRTILEQHEGSMKKVAEKILMNKIKQEILSLKTSSTTPQNILPTFHPLETTQEEKDSSWCGHIPAPGTRVRVKSQDGEWQVGKITSVVDRRCVVGVADGQTVDLEYPSSSLELIDPCRICFPDVAAPKLPAEVIDAAKTANRSTKAKGRTGRLYENESDDESFSSDSEASFAVPTSGELDLETLASLPAHMRKDVIEASRREERARKRGTYLVVASDPKLYSETQITNFLRTR